MAIGALVAMVPVWLALSFRPPWARTVARSGWAVLLRGFGIRVRSRGVPAAATSVLFVANHVSWADIPVLAHLLDAGFVAKQEVRGWPLIGPLAQRYGCLFVARDRRGGAARQADGMRAHLDGGRRLVLFPEGTTGPGDGVLPFRSSLFAAADALPGCVVQPVTLVWRARDGGLLDAAGLRRIAWLDDDALLPHALALAAGGGALAEVCFGAAFPVTDRKAAAAACAAAIAATLADARRDDRQAATLNRAA